MSHPRRVRYLIGTTVKTALLAAIAGMALVLGSTAAAHADQAPPGKAWIRAGHLVPGVGTTRIDLVPASGPTTSIVMSPAASYGDVTSYQKIDPGDYTVYVRPQGASLEAQPMLQRAFTVTAGKATTLAVVGTATSPRFAVLDDDLTLPAADAARVRVLPAASNAQTLSVTAANGPTLTSGAVLGQATAYASVPAGSWTLNLASSNGVTAQQTVDLASGSVYSASVLDSSANGVAIKVITDAAGATAAPQGAAQTGGGGAATQLTDGDSATAQPALSAGQWWPMLVSVAVLASLVVALGVARRPRRGSARSTGSAYRGSHRAVT